MKDQKLTRMGVLADLIRRNDYLRGVELGTWREIGGNVWTAG